MAECLINKIKKSIKDSEKGSISYSDFISLALYDQDGGYYMKDRKKIGKEGDFYTNSNVHSVFGKVLARIFVQLVQKDVLPPTICEIGAGTGRLASFILDEWEKIDPVTFAQLNYHIIEMSPYHRREQLSTIQKIEKVCQYESIDEMFGKIGKYTGFVLSNELFDAFPVDVLQRKGNEIYEARVTVEDDALKEVLIPCERVELLNWLRKNGIALRDGQRMEIPIAMNKWLDESSVWLEKGIMFTIDYGYTKEEWMEPIHREGSLRGFYKHQMIRDPLLHPGDMDVTTHIHLDTLIEKGEQVDLTFLAMLKQYQFLLRGGILEYLQEHYDPNPFSEVSKQNRAIRNLLLDDGISASFTVVIQKKELPNITIDDVLLYNL